MIFLIKTLDKKEFIRYHNLNLLAVSVEMIDICNEIYGSSDEE